MAHLPFRDLSRARPWTVFFGRSDIISAIVSDTIAPGGRILLRIPRGLHSELSLQAKQQGVSLNQYVGILLASSSGWRPEQGQVRRQVPMGLPGFMPDHAQERRADYLRSTPAQRLAEAINLSRTATKLAAAGAAARKSSDHAG
jgi:hypothetical protein